MNKNELIASLKEGGFSSNIVNAFKEIRRENFVEEAYKKFAYQNEPLPIGHNQTISQPYTIAFMLSLLELKDNQKILEVGSGSGYVLSLINKISKNSKIYGIERVPELFNKSTKLLKREKNIKVILGDGTFGLEKKSPFDRILISASAEEISKRLLTQLNTTGIIVCVVGNSIIIIKKTPSGNKIIAHPGFIFVPLISDFK